MSDEFDTDFSKSNQETEEQKQTDDPFESAGFHEYTVPEDGTVQNPIEGELAPRKTKVYSVVSLVTGILSVVCCCFGFVSLIFGVAAIVFAVISRKHLGYFEGMAVAGLATGIFGTILVVAVIVLPLIFGEEFESILEQFNWDEIFEDATADPTSTTRYF